MSVLDQFYYVLDKDNNPVLATVEQWVLMFEDYEKRTLGKDQVGGRLISTVFLGVDQSFGLGIDQSFGLGGDPVLFETMVFDMNQDLSGGPINFSSDYDIRRYTTYDAALEGHRETVTEFKNKPKIRLVKS